MVGEAGLEPAHPYGHRNLNPARLPIPPLARGGTATLPDPLWTLNLWQRRLPQRAQIERGEEQKGGLGGREKY